MSLPAVKSTQSSRPGALPRALTLIAVIAFAVAAGLFAFGGTGDANARASAKQSKKPNVIVVMTDDQTVDDLRYMTKTKGELAKRGVNFKNSFVSYSLCCPSRATFFSGQYAHNHHVMGLDPPTGGYVRFDRQNSLSTWLQNAGYYTGHIGKMMNGYGTQVPADVPPGFSEWYGAKDPTTYSMWGYTLNVNGKLQTFGKAKPAYGQDPALYQTDKYTDLATDYIRRRSNQSKPFFLSLAYLAPHHETPVSIRKLTGRTVRPAPRHQGRFANAPLPRPRGFDEKDLSDKPPYVQRHSPPLTQKNIDAITANYRNRQEALQSVDEGVQRIFDTLRATGAYKNTYVIFTSDNGFLQGEHRVRSGKMLPYDPSIRVPLMIEGPDLPRGKSTRELVSNVDLAPTVMDLADGPAGKTMDGRSLIPYAKDVKRRSERVLLEETGGQKPGKIEPDEGPVAPLKNILTYQGVRTQRYLYVRYKSGDRELYDMKYDPAQTASRHDDVRYRDTRTALARELRRLVTCKGKVCRKKARPIPGPAPKVVPLLGIGPSETAVSPASERRR